MVLHKELRVCNWDLHALVLEDNIEIARGTVQELMNMCNDCKVPKNAFVKSIDILMKQDVGKGRFRTVNLKSSLLDGVPYLLIKVKQKVEK